MSTTNDLLKLARLTKRIADLMDNFRKYHRLATMGALMRPDVYRAFDDLAENVAECCAALRQPWSHDATFAALQVKGYFAALEEGTTQERVSKAKTFKIDERFRRLARGLMVALDHVQSDILITASEPNPEGAKSSGKRKRMTAKEANNKAMELARKLKRAFFWLTETAQAKQIGCHLKTWRETKFYRFAQRKRPREQRGKRLRKAVSFTEAIEATTGSRDELQRLIEDQQANYEPSPLDPDPPDRPRTVRERKRL